MLKALKIAAAICIVLATHAAAAWAGIEVGRAIQFAIDKAEVERFLEREGELRQQAQPLGNECPTSQIVRQKYLKR